SSQGEPEMTPIYADPTAQGRSEMAVGDEHADPGGGGGSGAGGGFGGEGPRPPPPPPAGGGGGGGGGGAARRPGRGEGEGACGGGGGAAGAGREVGGGGGISGDVAYETKDVGASLDQIAREILRHLRQHKLTVVWMFDESESMKDDQREIKEKFDRVIHELKV